MPSFFDMIRTIELVERVGRGRPRSWDVEGSFSSSRLR